MKLSVRGLSVRYDSTPVLDGVTFAIPGGEVVGLIGPNGSGKTTLLKCIDGLLRFRKGSIKIDSDPVDGLSRRELGRRLGLLPQEGLPDSEMTVEEIVGLGRYPHLRLLDAPGPEDRRIIDEAIRSVGLAPLRHRPVLALSGGERQKVLLARALAQEPDVLLLDEPTTHLDARAQLESLELIREVTRRRKLACLAVFHDLNLAARFADRLLLLACGSIVAAGAPAEVLRPDRLAAAFEVEARLVDSGPRLLVDLVRPLPRVEGP